MPNSKNSRFKERSQPRLLAVNNRHPVSGGLNGDPVLRLIRPLRRFFTDVLVQYWITRSLRRATTRGVVSPTSNRGLRQRPAERQLEPQAVQLQSLCEAHRRPRG